jgi:hypothetical protein
VDDHQNAERGSVLVVALILALGIAFALGSYLQLGRSALELSNRTFYANAATNLAETGLEHGMWAMSRNDWTAWTDSGPARHRTLTGFKYGGNITGSVRVYVQDWDSAEPIMYSRSTVTPYQGAPVEKWIRVELQRVPGVSESTTAAFPIMGIVTPELKMTGAPATLDSYTAEPYAGNRTANIRITVLSLEAKSAEVTNSKIYGYIAVGTPDRSGLDDKKNSIIGDLNAQPGDRDPTRISYDAKMTIPAPTAPTEDLIALNYDALAGYISSGKPVPAGRYIVTDPLILSGEQVLNIAAASSVVFVLAEMTKAEGNALSVTGNASIDIPANSDLRIYTSYNVNLGGNSVTNAGVPANFVLYGTGAKDADPAQKIQLHGNGELNAVIYAPGAEVAVSGGGGKGHFKGGIVGGKVSLNGGVTVSWHEALGSVEVLTSSSSTTASVMRISHWQELAQASERSPHESKLSF